MSRYGVRGADRLSTGRWQGQSTGYNRSGGPGRIEFVVMERGGTTGNALQVH